MNTIIKTIQSMPGYIGGNGISETEITAAEKILSIAFAEDFRTYLYEIGLACFDGHELTGICKSSRLNVVDVTMSERANNPDVPKDWYVIEQANIDGIVIWQTAEGDIYQTAPYSEPVKIYDSLAAYIGI